MYIDDRPNLAVHLIRQEWYGHDRFAPDPAPPPRVGPGDTVQFTACPHRVPLTGPSCPDLPAEDSTGPVAADYPHSRWSLPPVTEQADNAEARPDQTSLGGTPSDIRPGGMLDVFA